MSPRQCVVQDCDCTCTSDPEVEISMHTSPLEDAVLSKWKRFVFQHRKNFKPISQFGVCSLHFTKDCFTCAVRIRIKGQMNQNFDFFYFSSILAKCV